MAHMKMSAYRILSALTAIAVSTLITAEATFTIVTESDNVLEQAAVRVTDSQRRTVWIGSTSANTIEWYLTDTKGNRVAPGEYYFHVSASGSKGYGSSPSKKNNSNEAINIAICSFILYKEFTI